MSAVEPRFPFESARSILASSRCALKDFRTDRLDHCRWFDQRGGVRTHAAGRALATGLMLAIAIVTGSWPIAQCRPIDLSHQEVGRLPREFAFWRAGRVDLGHWAVVGDGSGPGRTAIQRSDRDSAVQSALAVYIPVSALNAKVQTRFKLIDGSMPSAGVVLRVTDPDDYYLVRASSYEQRVSLLHVVHGTAEEIAAVNAEVSEEHWQTLQVIARDNEFTILLDDRWILTAFDRRGLTAGQFGVWTERDDTTRFDQIEISPLTSGVEQSDWRGQSGAGNME